MSHYSVRSESGSVLIQVRMVSRWCESEASSSRFFLLTTNFLQNILFSQPEEHDSKPFKLLKLIGRGGFGNVYLADWEDGERVAIKIIQVSSASTLCILDIFKGRGYSATVKAVCKTGVVDHPRVSANQHPLHVPHPLASRFTCHRGITMRSSPMSRSGRPARSAWPRWRRSS